MCYCMLPAKQMSLSGKMADTKVVTTAVLLLFFLSTHQVIAQDPLTVSITVNRTDPPGFTSENPSDYRAASGPQVVTCTATGGTGDGPTYQWSSTCIRCAFSSRTDAVITRTALHSADIGTHTCTATRGGVTAMDSIVFNIVGAGIHVFNGLPPIGSQPNNGLVRPIDTASTNPETRRLRFFCRTDSTVRNLGELIGLGGTAITTNDVFNITTNRIGGEIEVVNFVISDNVTFSEQGVYTCRIPLQSGVMSEINIGIYPNAFNSVPTITNPLEFTQGSPSSTLTCTSTTSIATTVTFMRDGNAINGIVRDGDSATVNGVTYQLSQTLTNRIQSTYDNVLTITEAQSSLAGSNFTCQVENALGKSQTSQSFRTLVVDISVSYTPPPGFTPGPNEYRAASGPVIVTCTATGGSGSGDYDYEWTSTCSHNFRITSTGAKSVIFRTSIHSGDIGTHTCTASRGGDIASDSIVFNVVGPGIHVLNGLPPIGSQPNNGLVRPIVFTHPNPGIRRLRFICRTDSTVRNLGELIGPGGTAITTNDVFEITTNTNGGEIEVVNFVISDNVTSSEQGVYTCRIPLQSGVMTEINIGIYPNAFNSVPAITNPLVFTKGSPSSTLTCTSTTSIATNVTFMREGIVINGIVRDGDSATVNGVTYQLSQTLTNRTQSTYDNVLTITEALSSLAGSTFTCQVENALGQSQTSQSFHILVVEISVSYSPPPGFTPGPNEYRAASGPVIVTCTATGGSGSGDYDYVWTSACSRCRFRITSTGAKSVIYRTSIHSGDIGTHTCTASRGGDSASASIVFNVVGAGIHVFNGLPPIGSQPNNGLVRPIDTTSTNPGTRRLRFFCRTDSTVRNLGVLIGPGGTAITTNDVFNITTNRIGGEIEVVNFVISDNVTSSEQGVYTCRIPLQSEEMSEINIGIYPNAFNSVPAITNPLVFTQGSPSSTLTCTSTTSIATTVTFMREGIVINGIVRDGDSATVNGVTYQLSQTLTNRIQSTYDNVLTITEALSSLAGSTFTCQVENALGQSQTSQSFHILVVEISVSYSPPPGFTPGPNEYRAASGPVVVTCTATGGSGSGDYQYVWTSTCSRCNFRRTTTGVNSVVGRTAVRSGDIGTHTCTAVRGGDSASASIVFNVVGAGIHVFNGLPPIGSQPNNGLVRPIDTTSTNPKVRRLRFFCRTDSTVRNLGELIGLGGTAITTNDVFNITTDTNGGEIEVVNFAISDIVTSSEQGVYTCRIPLQSEEMSEINIGIYPNAFNSGPTISDPLLFTLGSPSTITCISTVSPATNVTFMRGSTTVGPLRDGESVFVGGVTYELAQTVTNRRESTYENILTINDDLANIVDDTFICTVVNILGMDTSPSITISAPSVTAAIDVSGSRVIGGNVTLICDVTGLSSLASDTTITFSGPKTATSTGNTSLQLLLDPALLSDAGQYTCMATVTSSVLDSAVGDTETEDLRLQIPASASVSHDGGTTLYAGIVLTLTCEITVTGIPADMFSDVSATWTGPSGNELSHTGRITVTPAVLDFQNGTTYFSTVEFDTLRTNHNGMYTCWANINPSESLTFIDASNSSDVITLVIQIPTLDLSAISSTTRLPDVTPYNTFILTCTATAPEGVVAPKTFTWRRADPADGTCGDFRVVGGSVDSNLEHPVSTSVLKVTVSETDIGGLRFCCQASIAGANRTSTSVLFIDVVGPASPMQPTGLGVISTDATTATVQWTVPLIAYTPETYIVRYSTGSLTRQVLMSDPVESGADFDAVNQMFSVELTGLKPNIAYNYQVISSNTVGTNTSEAKILTTAPGGGGGGSNSGAFAGGVIAAIIIILVVFIIILFTWLYRRRKKIKQFHVPSPFVQDINPTPGQELESIRYIRVAEKVTAAKNVAPIIQEFPENDVTFLEGEGLSFAIQVDGVPTPSTVWYQDGKELVSDYTLEIAGGGSLTIPSVEPRHSGSYKLVVSNQAGSKERTVKVTVLSEVKATFSTPSRWQQVDETPIPVAEFGKYVATNHSNNNRGFRGLFDALYNGDDRPVANAKSAKNRPFNRFANITVYDDSRISLQPLPGRSDCQREYINASYVDGYSIPKKYIATQGPLPKTNVDFWRLVWQERSPSIVMLTNLREGNKMKCQQYWPEYGSMKFGPFQITITDQQIFADYVIRTFSVQLTGSSERPLKVTQFHFTAWPDHDVPQYATSILTFHRRVVTQHVPSRGPLVVHCSAGVGRTGTFITIDCVLEQLQKEQVIDIFGTVDSIRHQRMNMVQTVEQFSFVHDAVLESVTCGDTQIAAANFRLEIHNLERRDPQTHKSGFESQFQVLHLVSPKPDEVRREAAIRYCDMNRSVDYLPPDQYRVVLKGEVPDYIHAVSANGYKQQKAFIITENPMERTCRNFWKMLYSRKCAAIVMLSQLVEDGQEVCYQYWPTSGVKQIGEFVVDLLGEEKLEGFVLRTLSMLDTTSGKAQQITQFHTVNWAPNGHCSNLQTVTDIIEEVGKVQRKTGNHPIAIHCSDTVCRSGMFCSIATTIERCKTEGVVDVFQVVKALRVQKPGAVLTVAQYQHVFEAVLVFLDSFDTYANFQNI